MKVNIDHSKTCISQLYREYKQGDIILKPSYQRDFVWTQEMKDRLLDSFLSGLPIHDIVLASFSDRLEGYQEVIDGKHRLSVIFEYFENMESGVAKKYLARKPLNITVVIDPSMDDILEIYQRLNYGGMRHD